MPMADRGTQAGPGIDRDRAMQYAQVRVPAMCTPTPVPAVIVPVAVVVVPVAVDGPAVADSLAEDIRPAAVARAVPDNR